MDTAPREDISHTVLAPTKMKLPLNHNEVMLLKLSPKYTSEKNLPANSIFVSYIHTCKISNNIKNI